MKIAQAQKKLNEAQKKRFPKFCPSRWIGPAFHETLTMIWDIRECVDKCLWSEHSEFPVASLELHSEALVWCLQWLYFDHHPAPLSGAGQICFAPNQCFVLKFTAC